MALKDWKYEKYGNDDVWRKPKKLIAINKPIFTETYNVVYNEGNYGDFMKHKWTKHFKTKSAALNYVKEYIRTH